MKRVIIKQVLIGSLVLLMAPLLALGSCYRNFLYICHSGAAGSDWITCEGGAQIQQVWTGETTGYLITWTFANQGEPGYSQLCYATLDCVWTRYYSSYGCYQGPADIIIREARGISFGCDASCMGYGS